MAIRHVVLWEIGVDEPAMRRDTIELLSERLEALVGVIPGLLSLSAGPNSVNLAGNWDMALVADVEDRVALDSYAVHPAHLEVAKDLRAVATARAAVDFEVDL